MRFEESVSGSYTQQYEYKSFSPTPINHEWTWDDPRINTLLEEASLELAKLNAHSLIVPDVDRYIYMHVVKEANSSSRIEGTRTEMDEALRDTSRKGVETFRQIMLLRGRMHDKVTGLGARAANGMRLLDRLYMNPLITVREAAEHLNVAQPTASTLISMFVEQGILEEITGNKRNREFFFQEYYRLFTA